MIRAFGAHCHEPTFELSLDHLVGEREQLVRDFEAERSGGFEIKHEIELH
jgi:hypothetical protein